MRALVRLAHGKAPDCTRCALGEEHVRRQFGCDEPAVWSYAERPKRLATFHIACTCRDGKCDRCDRGRIAVYHCPLRLLDACQTGEMVRRAYRVCTHYPLLPVAGGISDQSTTYLDALAVYQHEVAAIQREEQKEADLKAEGERRRAQRGR